MSKDYDEKLAFMLIMGLNRETHHETDGAQHRLDAIQKVQDLEVTIKSRLNINAGLNIRDLAYWSLIWKSNMVKICN